MTFNHLNFSLRFANKGSGKSTSTPRKKRKPREFLSKEFITNSDEEEEEDEDQGSPSKKMRMLTLHVTKPDVKPVYSLDALPTTKTSTISVRDLSIFLRTETDYSIASGASSDRGRGAFVAEL